MASPGRWAAIPVSYQLDPRVLSLSVEAEVFCTRAWLYAGEHCTDGLVPQSALPLLTMKLAADPAALAEELVRAGLAKRRSEGFVLSDFPTGTHRQGRSRRSLRREGRLPSSDGQKSKRIKKSATLSHQKDWIRTSRQNPTQARIMQRAMQRALRLAVRMAMHTTRRYETRRYERHLWWRTTVSGF